MGSVNPIGQAKLSTQPQPTAIYDSNLIVQKTQASGGRSSVRQNRA